MNKIKIIIFLIFTLTFVQFSYGDSIEIKVKINDKSLIWNSNLIEALELENLLLQA